MLRTGIATIVGASVGLIVGTITGPGGVVAGKIAFKVTNFGLAAVGGIFSGGLDATSGAIEEFIENLL